MDAVRSLSNRNFQAGKRSNVIKVYQLLELLNIASLSIYKQLFSYNIVVIDPLIYNAHIITVLGIACHLIALLIRLLHRCHLFYSTLDLYRQRIHRMVHIMSNFLNIVQILYHIFIIILVVILKSQQLLGVHIIESRLDVYEIASGNRIDLGRFI